MFDKLTIDTPEQVELEFPLAGIGSRFLAMFVDTILQGIAVILLLVLLAIAGAGNVLPRLGELRKWELALYIVGAFSIYWAYFVLFETFWRGQTPGKRQAGIRVLKDSGREITLREAIGRNLLRSVDALPGIYFVGMISVFLSRQNKRLGDYVAGTVVVHERSADEAQPFWNTRENDGLTFGGIETLTPEEIQMIEIFLSRRLDLPASIRQQTAERIFQHICSKVSAPDEQKQDIENFLELVVRQFRKSARYR